MKRISIKKDGKGEKKFPNEARVRFVSKAYGRGLKSKKGQREDFYVNKTEY